MAESSPESSGATEAASRAIVGVSKSTRGGRATPSAARIRETARTERIELPPSAKKSSWTPIRGTPSTSVQMAASVSSTAVRGASSVAASLSRTVAGSGSALRSTLSLGVSGRASRTTTVAGTMWSGRPSARKARRVSDVGRCFPAAAT